MDLVEDRRASRARRFLLSVGDRVFGRRVTTHYDALRAEHSLGTAAKQRLTRQRLHDTLVHARTHSPYYRQAIPAAWDSPFQALRQLPPLTKEIIKDKGRMLLTAIPGPMYTARTGGTTRPRTTVHMLRHERDRHLAQRLLQWGYGGYTIGDPALQLGATRRDLIRWCKDVVFRTTYAHTRALDNAGILGHLRDIGRGRYRHLIGYPSRLKQFCHLARAHRMEGLRLQSVIALGDKVLDEDRQLLQEVFGCRVVETYGATEGFIIGVGVNTNALDVLSTDYVVEVLDEAGDPCDCEQLGRIILTSLCAKKMPLIRYDIGDIGYWVADACGPLGKRLRVEGRALDYIHDFNGKPVTTRAVYSLLNREFGITHFVLEHQNDGAYELGYQHAASLTPVAVSLLIRRVRSKCDIRLAGVYRTVKVPRYPSGKPVYIGTKSVRHPLD